ncbi:hypothetical protein Asphe3_39450 [Pseudarthrobacter phenanthrenivorans Sphe3]|uniref:Uncharacterized protein n=1 Tax=Pseudarthrobacter phenanthrenivorans (strain DSM 18606 / JCM 16027 / LMG 23796 / Sphe3) TaxID=930171 RepID=F0MA46_PSEPM|nr:DUF6492 family protein [Pseudarthrobacter phenanthrenivorans]ADX75033.1 hypothetical protein Asphe3_39450 [Pseudarthrobacter phenanthrenivorans Sphe3]
MESKKRGLVVVTPSYAPDSELCRDLNRSVLQWTPPDVQHHIIVPHQDLGVFRMLANNRTVIHDDREFLSSTIRRLPLLNLWMNKRRPWLPVRGWITQQLLKLSAAATLDAEAILLVDSDMVFVSSTGLKSFQQNGAPVLYRKPGAVHSGLPRHRQWLESAHHLLGLEQPGPEDLTDYICWPCAWDPRTVRSMLRRVEDVTGLPWQSAIACQLHFSEMMLYGAYVDGVLGGAPATTSSMNSVIYSAETPLSPAEISALLNRATGTVQAVMISAKSGIAYDVRAKALQEYADSSSRAGGLQ